MVEKENKVDFYGKVAKFPKNTKAQKAYNFLENIRIPKNKLWYFIIEKEIVVKDENVYEELQVIKYNNKEGVNCQKFVEALKEYYSYDVEISKHIQDLKIDGNDKFSIIRNIPNIEINGKKLISILTEDLIKLLYK
ncbi:MAG: hypothetical protein HPY57_13900 [Ignavibacteria bacterium]|nr:hypothetical protein [Ignavibacteria bacterium]